MLIDTHCHLGDPAYAPDCDAVLEPAWAAGVVGVVVIGESRAAAERALELAAGEPRLAATAGLHPHEASAWNADYAQWLKEALCNPRVVAAGEM